MTSTYKHPGRNDASQNSGNSVDTPAAMAYPRHAEALATTAPALAATCAEPASRTTAIEQCVQHELSRYFDMLDGEEPAHLYRMVMKQAENAVIRKVMTECRGNQTRASLWLGISRGNLRTKLANMEN